jgi:hypothetical protein
MRSLLVFLHSGSCVSRLLGTAFPNVDEWFLGLDLIDTNEILQSSSTPRYLVRLGIVLLGSKRVLCRV